MQLPNSYKGTIIPTVGIVITTASRQWHRHHGSEHGHHNSGYSHHDSGIAITGECDSGHHNVHPHDVIMTVGVVIMTACTVGMNILIVDIVTAMAYCIQ